MFYSTRETDKKMSKKYSTYESIIMEYILNFVKFYFVKLPTKICSQIFSAHI